MAQGLTPEVGLPHIQFLPCPKYYRRCQQIVFCSLHNSIKVGGNFLVYHNVLIYAV